MPNRLASATSPYLLQHKDNPVDWHEWGDEAFAEAKDRDVPILLSVGYSACHWCHVMAHESFEDQATAEEMNRMFVNVKVDREERPDVDSIYMEAVQAMTGRGGWPMTVWLAPDGRPFYAGTYFPKVDLHGMPSFRRVATGIADAWENQRDDLLSQADRLIETIGRSMPVGDALPGSATLESAYRSISATFDKNDGGFGGAPKFPQQPVLELLLRVRGESWAAQADEMLTISLTHMADGGIHDHLGGGFSRYSVDTHWLVPHFEKMLYDNGQLARLYLWAGIELDNTRFIEVCRSTLDYMLTDLRHPDGGFFSAEDADSEGVEGKFYVWNPEQLEETLGPDDAEEAARFFGVTAAGNFEGSNILHRPTGDDWDDRIESIRARLLSVRAQRVRPSLDDKVIAAWTGLAIRALAEAGAALEDETYLEAARNAARFVLDNLVVDGVLMRSWRDGRTSVPGFLDDHASMAVAFFSLFAATGEGKWFESAMELVGRLDRFTNQNGGFYTTPDDGEELVKRPTDQTDNPLPSGNALAAEALVLASLYTGDVTLRHRAEGALRSIGPLADRFPSMVGHHLAVLHSIHRGTRELAIVGPGWQGLSSVYWERYRPYVALAASPEDTSAVPLLADRFVEGKTLAYVCEGFVCNLPTDDAQLLRQQL